MRKRVHIDFDSFFKGIELRTRLARASELAAVGALESAKEVLYQDGNSPRTSQEYDLLARISFYRGFDEQSRELWLNAQQVSKTGISYSRELHILDEYKKRKAQRLRVFKFILIIWPILLLIALIGNFAWDKCKKKTAQNTLITSQQKDQGKDSTNRSTSNIPVSPKQSLINEQPAKDKTVNNGDHKKVNQK